MTTPEEFGPYVLLRSLGKGGMAEVFLAETDSHGVRRPVAIKRLLPPFNSDELLVSMLADEARLSVWLAHPAIVQVFDFGRVGQTYYIAMEFVDGCDLCRLVRVRGRARGRPLPLPTALYAVGQVTAALDYAHRRKNKRGEPMRIIHRDVSPHNVLISREGQVKLADFGLARATISAHKTHAGIIRGKFAYMPKEQAQGKEIDHRIDIFAAGATLYEALTGVRPYSALNLAQQLYQLEQPVPPPSSHVTEIPPEIDDLTMQALSPDVETRYQSAGELATDLHHALGQLSTPNDEARRLATLVAEQAGPAPEQYRPVPHFTLAELPPVETSLIGDELAAVRDASEDGFPDEDEEGDTIESGPPLSVKEEPERSDARQPSDSETKLARPRRAAAARPEEMPLAVHGSISEAETLLQDREVSQRQSTIAIDEELDEAETIEREPAAAARAVERALERRRPTAEEAPTTRMARPTRPGSLMIGALLLFAGGIALGLIVSRGDTGERSTPTPPAASTLAKPPTRPAAGDAAGATAVATAAVATAVRPAAADAAPTAAPDAGPTAGALPRAPQPAAPADAAASPSPPSRPRRAKVDRVKLRRREPPTPQKGLRVKRRPTAGAPSAPRAPSANSGFLTVTTEEPAVIYVDREIVGPAPVKRLALEAGIHQVKAMFDADKAFSSTQWVTVSRGKVATMSLSR